MARWLLRSVGVMLLTIYLAITATFFVVMLMPGDPIEALTQAFVRQYYMRYEEARALAEAITPYVPRGSLLEQYFNYMKNVLTGNLGVSISFSTGASVAEILADAIPWTVLVVGLALIISFSLGILIGMLLAYKHGSRLDSAFLVAFSIIRSIPEYVVAILFLWLFAFQLRLFPVRGRYDYWALDMLEQGDVLGFLKNVLWHAALPIAVWVFVHIGGWALGMRGSAVSVLGDDYIAYARARGLPSRRIVTLYVGKNSILPLFTSFMLSLGFMFGGSIFIEYIFAYQGVGWILYQAIQRRDWYLMLGAFDLIVVSVVIGAFLANLLYAVIDPRVRREGVTE